MGLNGLWEVNICYSYSIKVVTNYLNCVQICKNATDLLKVLESSEFSKWVLLSFNGWKLVWIGNTCYTEVLISQIGTYLKDNN